MIFPQSVSVLKLIGLLFLLVVCSAGSAQAANYDERKFCNAEARTVLVLVDVTTSFDERSKELFGQGINKIVQQFSGGERLIIATIEDTFTASSRLYEGCVPYCADTGWFSDCTEGLIILKSREQRNAISRVLRTRLNTTRELQNSDIIRTLTFSIKPMVRNDKKVSIYMFSDLIENSDFIPGKIFFRQPIDELMMILKENKLIPNLKNTSIRAFGIGRGGNIGRKPLSQPLLRRVHEFWESYFQNAGNTDFEISESLFVN